MGPDNAFDNITGPANPVTPIKDKWGEKTNDCKPFTAGGARRNFQQRADPIIGTLPLSNKSIKNYEMAFLAGPFAKETVEGLSQHMGWTDKRCRSRSRRSSQ